MLTEGEVDACVLYERVARITLNRPAVLNALDLRIHERLADVWTDFEADPDIWVGVLTGAGSKSFCVGHDLKELAQRIRDGAPPSTFGARGAPGSPRLTERFSISKPLIGASTVMLSAGASNSHSAATSSSRPSSRTSRCPRRSSD